MWLVFDPCGSRRSLTSSMRDKRFRGGRRKGELKREEGDKKRIPSLLLCAHFMFSPDLTPPYPFPLPGRLLKLKEYC